MRLLFATSVLISVLLATAMIAQEPTGSQQSSSSAGAENSHPKASESAKDDPKSSGRYHLKLGTVAFSGFYASGPWWYPYGHGYYPYYYGAAFWDPFWGPFGSYYYPGVLTYSDGKGQIGLKADQKSAAVYIDGAYAGTAQHLKTFWLDPGAYDLSVSAGHAQFRQRIYVLTGKTLTVNAKLALETPSAGTKPEKQ